MRPLHRSDPSAVAGHRLLGRLGAGGMGVVYLARTPGGALAAVKVIRAEHAADPAFRERFRREARTAERITGRWAVRVLGADPEAREPWLATEYVPGPSLAETLALYGPLPEAAVRALGARLADALAALHAGGLVHRDVKPANVLLAVDGPRLIDFGIARAAGATALTATDAMIGTPGYLAPEQARAAGAGEVGPPADVFALGCVLAYVVGGERPFGTGTVAAVVYRTVHEEPELGAVPGSLRPLVAACLAKDPAARPTAEAVRDALGGTEGPVGELLPPGLPALIAERSARVLDLPVPEPTAVVPAPPPRGPSRRALLAGGSAALVVTAGALAARLSGLIGGTGSGAAGGTDGGVLGSTSATAGNLPTYTIGVQTDLSGPREADGRAQERGVRLAVERFNARPDRAFDLAVKVHDDAGDPARAARTAAAIGKDRAVLAVVGPTSPEVVAAAAETYQRNALVYASVATGVDVGVMPDIVGEPSYFEMRTPVEVLSLGFSTVTLARKLSRVAVVEDAAAGNIAWAMGTSMEDSLTGLGTTVSRHQVDAETDDFGPAARAVKASGAQGVLYAGLSPARAARCARALAAAGFTGICGAVESVLEPGFLSGAGAAAEGWYFGTSYVDPAVLTTPSAKEFTAAHRARWGTSAADPVERYAAEAYDVTLAIAETMRGVAANGLAVERGALTRRLRELTYEGVTKKYGFDASNGFLFRNQVYVHRVEAGRVRCLGHYEKAAEKEKEKRTRAS
ncbi:MULTISPECIES: bifunctional serine/threonine-protein kinase/ABC transporter substrate-binding protein [Streptomyces]|uniref:Bifunctional serine/threonine-protein kinase/ABC transporter substrate-binding protein n=2 Tax=Streptomyces TaxID=1883 RepID=A0ABU4K994_9ACTN|nr:bifunctional serine/threonine-protein kinase/ABC transporter substrate-binding protein [Streptomyces roseolus]MDX2293950.1 bifunctional serine/threonine-protein kinase/ABC transporter substrate-binding protein [Streptomyces roseolus]